MYESLKLDQSGSYGILQQKEKKDKNWTKVF